MRTAPYLAYLIVVLLAAPAFAQGWLLSDGKRFKVLGADGKLTDAKLAYRKGAVLSPDGKRLLGAEWRDKNRDLYACDAADGKNEVRLTRHRAMDSAPDWAPDSRRFVFNSERSGSRQVWYWDPEKISRVTNEPDGAWKPRLSPDGKQVAYAALIPHRGKGWIANVVVMELATKKRRVLLEKIPMADFAWSPDGKELAVGSFALTVVHVETGKSRSWKFNELNKKLYAHHAGGVMWRPDGKQIAMSITFAGGRAAGTGADGNPEWSELLGDREIFFIDPDGKLTFTKLPRGVFTNPVAWLPAR